MSERYLWDRSGEVDVEVERLEETLSQLRPRRPLRVSPTSAWPARTWIPQAMAASLLIASAASLFVPFRPSLEKTPWQVLNMEGRAELGHAPARATASLYANQHLRTDAASRVTLEAEEVGRIDVGPSTELRVVESASSRQMLHLAYGTIHALIWAPPGQFVVDTPSSRAVDLGCQYTLDVDRSGAGLLKVETGWVAFQSHGREAFIPAGAMCRTSQTRGPLTPYFEDAGAPFRDAVDAFDRSETTPCPSARDCTDNSALQQILLHATPRDAMTLWHLLSRCRPADRAAVFDRFVQLAGLPQGVTRDGILAGNAMMLDRCWNALQLMDVDFWRKWKREWTGDSGRVSQMRPSRRE